MSTSVSHEANQNIVKLILEGNPRGGELLYDQYSRGLFFLAKRRCPEYAEDCMHDTIVAAIEQIRKGKLQNATALPGYLVVILKRTVLGRTYGSEYRECTGEVFDNIVRTRADEGACPSRELQTKQHRELMLKALKQLNGRDREILSRFYLQGETLNTIAQAMSMTEQQVSLLKHRSRIRLQSLVERESAASPRCHLEQAAV